MDTNFFLLPDSPISGFIIGGLVVCIVASIALLVSFVCALDEPGDGVLVFVPGTLLTVSALGIIVFAVINISNHNAQAPLAGETLMEIEDTYEVEFYSPDLDRAIVHLIAAGEENIVIPLEEISYLYEGDMYSTDLEVVYSSRGGERSIGLFQLNESKTTTAAPFDPAQGHEEVSPLKAE